MVTRLRDEIIDLAHLSCQFSDKTWQQRYDIRKFFNLKVDAWLGTEASKSSQMRWVLRTEARRAGIHLHIPKANTDTWIAVRKTYMPKITTRDYIKVIEGRGKKLPGPAHSEKGVTILGGETITGEDLTLLEAHYLTRRGEAILPESQNREYAQAIGGAARKYGKGNGIVLGSADFNLVDRKTDVFFGQPLTTCWDELGKYPGTGHGNIDAIFSYDRDGRVKCIDAEVFDDSEMFFHSDHFLVKAKYRIRRD